MADRVEEPPGGLGLEELLDGLTLEEQASLTAGESMWRTAAIPRMGIPAVQVTDGPNGARGARFTGPTSACFPCGSALGATWDPELVTEVAAAMGTEARDKGARVLLAPTVNLHRHPLAGRNFECHSEDPHLAARMAVAYVRGVQSRGVAATVKHLTANDAEWQRMTASSEVDERALRELYLRPFEAAVVEGGAWAVMTAYNKLGGTYCSEHPWLLGELLRGEWSFDGLVMSDWFGTHSTVDAVLAGLDLEMPGPPAFRGRALVSAVEGGRVPSSVVTERARRVLQLAERVGAMGAPSDAGPGSRPARQPEDGVAVDRPEHRALLRRAAAAGVVLLRNEPIAGSDSAIGPRPGGGPGPAVGSGPRDGQGPAVGPGLGGGPMAGDRRPVLPLDRGSIRRLAVIGANAANTQIQGGGSAGVSPHHTVTVLDGVRAACGEGIEVEHEPGCAPHRGIPPLDVRQLTADDGSVGMTISYARGDVPGGATVFTEVTRRTSLTWMGEPAPGVTAGDFTAVGHAVFTPTCSGVHTWSLSSAGRSRLYLDGQVVVDNWEPAAGGTSFFGAGSSPVEGTAMLEDARGYDLRVELSAAVPLAGVRLGCQPPVPADQLERAVALAAASDAAIVVVGTTPEWESEGFDRRTLALPGAQDELVARVADANPRCVVVLNTGAPVSAPWADAVPAVMQLWFAGQEAGHAAADVLFGEVNPSGRLPTTFPVRLEDTAGYLDLPGEDGRVRYSEGVFMGYAGTTHATSRRGGASGTGCPTRRSSTDSCRRGSPAAVLRCGSTSRWR